MRKGKAEGLGYFYITDKGIYYISIRLDSVVNKRRFYDVKVYDVAGKAWFYSAVVPAKSIERLEKALQRLVESVQPASRAHETPREKA
jgi:hypothetical protein